MGELYDSISPHKEKLKTENHLVDELCSNHLLPELWGGLVGSAQRFHLLWRVLTEDGISYPATVQTFGCSSPSSQPVARWSSAATSPLRSLSKQPHLLEDGACNPPPTLLRRLTAVLAGCGAGAYQPCCFFTCDLCAGEVLLALQFDVIEDDHLFLRRERSIHLHLGREGRTRKPGDIPDGAGENKQHRTTMVPNESCHERLLTEMLFDGFVRTSSWIR